MVEFLSLFLGLVSGLQPVELRIEEPVETVELRLDDRSIAQLRGEPWVAACDFGEQLAPQVLVAIGRDAEGREVARAEQWINLPRERLVIELRPEGDPPTAARLLWRSVEGGAPDVVRVVFDSEELELDSVGRVKLPSYDAELPHVLAAEIQVGREAARKELVVGGLGGEEVRRELTAFPVLLEGRGDMPSPEEMRGWFSRRGRVLEVVGVDEGPSEIILVQDQTPRIQGLLVKLRNESLGFAAGRRRRPTGLKFQDRLRVLWPVEVPNPGGHALDLFPLSADLAAEKQEARSTGVGRRLVASPVAEGLLATLPYAAAEYAERPHRLADAVAVAGLSAAAGGRPRVVVLVADPDTPDASAHSIASVRSYLAKLEVPLVIWSPISGDWDAWGEVESIPDHQRLFRTIGRLRNLLDRQYVVWLEGRHPSHEIELTAAARERLARVSEGSAASAEPPEFEAWLAEVPQAPPETEAVPEVSPEPEQVAEAPAEEPAPAAAPGDSAPLEGGFVDTVDVRLVNVDVVAATRDGEPVWDLTAEDFEVFEDGEKVEISHFVAPTPPAPQPVDEAGEPEAGASEAAPPEASGGAGEVHLAIFIDAINLNVRDRKRLFDALRDELLRDPLPGPTLVAVESLGTGIRQTFTRDVEELREVLEGLGTDAGAPPARALEDRRLVAEMMNYLAEISAAERIRDPDLRAAAIEVAKSMRSSTLQQLHALGASRRNEILTLLRSLEGMAASLGGIEGRKALIYVGDRLTLEPAVELYNAATEILELEALELAQVRSEGYSLNLSRDYQAMVRRANGSGVTLYTLTPPDLELYYSVDMPSFGGGQFNHTRDLNLAGVSTELGDLKLAGIKEAACMLSTETGGLCQVGGSEPRLLLQRALRDLEASYLLAYAPPREADGKYHEIEVRTRRDGLKLRHRDGVKALLPEDRLEERLEAALFFGAEENGLGFELELEAPQHLKKRLSVLPLQVSVPVKRLAMLPVPGAMERRGASLRLLLAVVDAKGRRTEVQSLPLGFQVREERLADPAPLVYRHKVNLTIPQGATRVGVVLFDEFGQAVSVAGREIPVVSGEQESR